MVLGAVWTFNMFNVVFLVSAGEPDSATEILISQAYRFAFTRGHQYGYAAAYAVLIFLVLALQDDGRVWVAPATIDGKVGLRPCFVNFRTTDDDVRALADVAATRPA